MFSRAVKLLSRRHAQSLATLAIACAVTMPGAAQSRATVTADDYSRAEKFLNYNTGPLVANGPVRANWLQGDRFWYRNQGATAAEFFLVDAVKGTKAPAFNHAAVATALTAAMGKPVTAARLPFQQITFAADSASFSFDADGKRWTCDVQGTKCSSADRPATVPNSELSPDGKYAAYIKDWNLFVRDMTTGRDIQLTTEGLRLRHRQRRLDQQRAAGGQVVARLEEARHLPAGSAQERRHVPGQYRGRPSHASGVEVPAAR
jgi:hypothetical protein